MELPVGLYNLNNGSDPETGDSVRYLDRAFRYDNCEPMRAGAFEEAYLHLEKFFDPIGKQLRKDLGMFDKTSLLFKGLPGTGKTHLACTLAKHFAKMYDGVAVVITDIRYIDFKKLAKDIRLNDKDEERLIIFVFDELEKNSSSWLESSDFLNYLDGARSVPNSINIATVNNVDKLPSTMLGRPGRWEVTLTFELNDPLVLRFATLGLLPEKYHSVEGMVDIILNHARHAGVRTIDKLRFVIMEVLRVYLTTGELPGAISKLPEPSLIDTLDENIKGKYSKSELEMIANMAKQFPGNDELFKSICLSTTQVACVEEAAIKDATKKVSAGTKLDPGILAKLQEEAAVKFNSYDDDDDDDDDNYDDED